MHNDYRKLPQTLQDALLKQQQQNAPLLMLEYVPNAEFQFWLQRIFKSIILCLVSCIALIIFCEINPGFKDVLYGFFKWVLIPVKPLLLASPSAALAGFITFITPFSSLFNLLAIPLVVFLAMRASRLSSYLCIKNGELLIIQQLSPLTQANEGTAMHNQPTILKISSRFGGRSYKLLKSIPLSSIKQIVVERPEGKKSFRDYRLLISRQDPLSGWMSPIQIRWGDIIKAEDRNRFLKFLEETFPQKLDSTMFEPFRQAPERQSYTELWLRELSGAPKRDKLTPLIEGATLANENYSVLRKVGVGGQGTVYLAASPKHAKDGNDLVILKEFVLPVFPDLRVRKKAAERFQAEAAILQRLDHPQIAKFLDLFVEDHRAYLVLEHVEGTTLKDLVANQGPLPEKQVIQLSLQIAEILAYLHRQTPPVVHRDLTPDNIMLEDNGMAKLIDFSVAQELSGGVTGSVVGKPNYISPEQFRGKPSTQSDLYSLGATMFYLLIGHDPPAISVLHPEAVNGKISPELDRIIARCTQLELSKRYENAEQVVADLEVL